MAGRSSCSMLLHRMVPTTGPIFSLEKGSRRDQEDTKLSTTFTTSTRIWGATYVVPLQNRVAVGTWGVLSFKGPIISTTPRGTLLVKLRKPESALSFISILKSQRQGSCLQYLRSCSWWHVPRYRVSLQLLEKLQLDS